MARDTAFIYRGLQSAGKVSGSLTKKLLSEKKNFLASILYDWPVIVGPLYAQTLKPKQVSFPKNKNTGATLHLSVLNGSAALLIHHVQAFILERVNQFVGHAAFHKISLHQASADSFFTPLYPSPSLRVLSAEEEKEVNSLLVSTPEGDLKEALKQLGESLYRSKASS
jgi:hypothetical protein